MEDPGYRLSVLANGEWIAHRYPGVFNFEGSHLVAAPEGAPLKLAIQLLDVIAPPYLCELEVLEPEGLAALEGEVVTVGRDVDRPEMTTWLADHAALLQSDARLAVLVHGAHGERIVYDEHNRLLLSGPLLEFESALLSLGLQPGDVSVPMPHAHHYRDDLTAALSKLITP